ncbi:MAG: GTPase-activating protein [Deinococcus sp.]|nr:GTPase-activating protein [Deinococcus sp.]
MQGLLSDLPLIGIMELINGTRQTGVLEVKSEVPYTVAYVEGEIVAGGILDWLGVDAIHASPMLPDNGTFAFELKPVTGTALGPYDHFMTDWARASDEWTQICAIIGSPSRVFQGNINLFNEAQGRSVRAAARQADLPLFQVAQQVAEAVKEGKVTATERYAWFGLRLRPGGKRAEIHPIARALDGEVNLGQLVEQGFSLNDVREYLLGELRLGLRFPGSGWVMRDLIWEQNLQRQLGTSPAEAPPDRPLSL